ncbi:hypothetical protein ANI_1_1334144 [Paecilomyces variotii No. 5]|uniref:Enoyl reductase (ER) domain-containing protein n=1 Tax=Byssochlamys spectabilis (strain No. 5 / NBRC 109023) TaxID=1356009 RepID=V5G110_BYSSN|nr:hypothetical protein ANI_1_1334144 [Paecilomyces variotii No. 5]
MGSTIPATRKVAVTTSPPTVSITSLPIPQPAGTEVLLQIEATGICATDLHIVQRSLSYFQPKVDIHGHEGIGRIVALGPDVDASKWKIGDKVAHRWIYRWCKECEPCRAGLEQFCDKRQLSGLQVEGCWAEYTVADTEYMLRIPEGLDSAEAAPILCAGTTVYRALRTSELSPGQWVAIVGAGGGLGHLAIQYAKVQGLKVLAIDGGKEKEKLCTDLGADVYIDFTSTKDITATVIDITSGGAHGILVTSSSPRAYEQAITYVRKMGIIVCIGATSTKMTFPIGPEYFVGKGVRLTGTSTGTLRDTEEALELVRQGKVKPIIVEKKLEDIPECLDLLAKGDAVGKFVVKL